MTTPATQLVRLLDPLPCASRQGIGVCGQPAYAATVWPIDSVSRFVFPSGVWALQPICPTCVAALAARYADGDQVAQFQAERSLAEMAQQHNFTMRR